LERNKLDEPPIANYRLAVAAISTWLEAIGNCRRVARSLPGDACFELRYEQLAGLNLLTWLTSYLDECSRNGGNPSPARTWTASCPGTPAPATSAPGHSRRHRPHKPAANTPAPAWLRTGHADYQHAPSQDSRIPTRFPLQASRWK
jgi:hypothetical protein